MPSTPFRITLTSGQFETLDLRTGDVTPDDLAAALGHCPVGPKVGPAVILATFRPCPAQCAQAGSRDPSAVDCGGNRLHRLDRNVEAVTGFGIDADELTTEGQEELLRRLPELGLEAYVWETHSSAPAKPKMRVVFPFAEPFTLDYPAQWAAGLWPALVAHLGLEGIATADQSCKNSSRIYNLPRKPSAEEVRRSWSFAGARLDWREVSFSAPAPRELNAADANAEPPPTASQFVVDAAVAEVARYERRGKGGGRSNAAYSVARLLLEGYALPEEQARPLLDAFNAALPDPFTDVEVDHKISDVTRKHVEGRRYDPNLPSFGPQGFNEFGDRRRFAEQLERFEQETGGFTSRGRDVVEEQDIKEVDRGIRRALGRMKRGGRTETATALRGILLEGTPPKSGDVSATFSRATKLLGQVAAECGLGASSMRFLVYIFIQPAFNRTPGLGLGPSEVAQ